MFSPLFAASPSSEGSTLAPLLKSDALSDLLLVRKQTKWRQFGGGANNWQGVWSAEVSLLILVALVFGFSNSF